jgi:TolB-like protein/tRNA A-37 threonylcarbamoyl transferase component Bud32/Tfp pilus assembly protein PilF
MMESSRLCEPRLTGLLARLQAALADRYSVDRAVGRGGMATVFLAEDLKHRRSVAIKVLHPELATSLGVERFLREIGIAAGLTHPHILALYDSGQAADLLYYVMPYIEGETLRGRLERERQLSMSDAVRIASEIADALGYAHSRGVVHRDIKPENIMFSAGSAVVADFGIARALTAATLEPLTASGVIVGTPAYMSPEQATSGGQLDGRSDIYSLGCVVYEMLTGSVPFTGPTAQAVMARHSVDVAPPIRSVRPTVPDALERAVLTALAKVPADRFATAAQFAGALAARAEPTADGAEGESIAVLPFANLSGDPEFDYFSEGIAEEIINALTQLPGLRVAARTSSFAFRGPAIDLAEVGAKLKVATVLEGSARKAGNRLRINVQLVKVGDGYHLWSERYDREMTDVFAMQDEIAKAIANRLQVTLGGEETPLVTPATGNLDAYHLYLKGRYYLAQRGLGLKRALGCFDQALSFDPNYALAHAGLADACTVFAEYGLALPNGLRPKARAAVQRALELAPDLAEVHCASGALAFICDWDWPRAARDLQRAVELNPRYVPARQWLSYYLVFIEGRAEEAVAQARRAVELDPLASLVVMQLGMTLMGAGRYEEAAAPLQRAAELAPAMFLPTIHLGLLYNHLGRSDEAIAPLEVAVTASGRHPWTLAALAVCYSSLGKLADVEAIRDELLARARREYVQSTVLAIVAASLRNMDATFELLDRACDEHDGILVYSKRYPFFTLLQNDPRMERIYRRIGFPEAAR